MASTIAMLLALSPIAPSARAAGDDVRPVDVTLHDFGIKTGRESVAGGQVVLHVHNAGPSTHEINVDRTSDSATELPLKDDGLTVNEDDRSLQRIDSIEQLDLGATEDLRLRLKPGHYVLYCNLEGHYLGGMRVALNVVARRSS